LHLPFQIQFAIHLNPADHKKVVLGTKPILLSAFSSGGQRHIFAASDRPTIIYSNNKKLLYSNLNENEV
jgi:DNA damage-binding protein 1